jgi:predicted ATPase
MIGGGPGAGKSTLTAQREGLDEAGRRGYVHIDADAIRDLFPEYKS